MAKERCSEKHDTLQASESRIEAMKKQQAQDLKREAHLSAEAEANKRSIADRDQALRQAGQQTGTNALPNGLLSQEVVTRQVLSSLASGSSWSSYFQAGQ